MARLAAPEDAVDAQGSHFHWRPREGCWIGHCDPGRKHQRLAWEGERDCESGRIEEVESCPGPYSKWEKGVWWVGRKGRAIGEGRYSSCAAHAASLGVGDGSGRGCVIVSEVCVALFVFVNGLLSAIEDAVCAPV